MFFEFGRPLAGGIRRSASLVAVPLEVSHAEREGQPGHPSFAVVSGNPRRFGWLKLECMVHGADEALRLRPGRLSARVEPNLAKGGHPPISGLGLGHDQKC